MLSAAQCLAKADEMEARARAITDKYVRNSYLETAKQWREVAAMAEWQETWPATHDAPSSTS
jgi:hypothetical protein